MRIQEKYWRDDMEVRENIRMFREKRGISQKALGNISGKSESAIQGYETGKTDIPLSALEAIAKALKVSLAELVEGKKKVPENKPMELRIYNLDDRMAVTQILVKNGYTVSQGKRQRSPTGKTLDYFLKVVEDADNADTSK